MYVDERWVHLVVLANSAGFLLEIFTNQLLLCAKVYRVPPGLHGAVLEVNAFGRMLHDYTDEWQIYHYVAPDGFSCPSNLFSVCPGDH